MSPKAPKSLREIEQELGGVGAKITIEAKLAGIVDFGREVQLELPDGLLIYVPTESMQRFVK